MEIVASGSEIHPVSSDQGSTGTEPVPADRQPVPAEGEIPREEVLPSAPDYMGNTIDTTA